MERRLSPQPTPGPAASSLTLPDGMAALGLRSQPASARGRKTLERILDATVELAAEAGFDAVNTNLIASRAGVNIASLYKYFPNKQSIFLAISWRMASAFHLEAERLINQVHAGRPWREALPEGIRLAARRRLDTPGERAIRMAIRLSPEFQGLDAAETRANAGLLADLIIRRSGAPEARAQRVSVVAVELAAAILDLLLSSPPQEAEGLVEEACQAFIRYLEPWLEGTSSGAPGEPPPSGR